MKQINIEKLDDIQLSLVLSLENNKGDFTHMITKQADEFYNWLKEKRKDVTEKEVVNETLNLTTGTNVTYLMHSFESDEKSSSKTKCKICGLEKWQHPVITYT